MPRSTASKVPARACAASAAVSNPAATTAGSGPATPASNSSIPSAEVNGTLPARRSLARSAWPISPVSSDICSQKPQARETPACPRARRLAASASRNAFAAA